MQHLCKTILWFFKVTHVLFHIQIPTEWHSAERQGTVLFLQQFFLSEAGKDRRKSSTWIWSSEEMDHRDWHFRERLSFHTNNAKVWFCLSLAMLGSYAVNVDTIWNHHFLCHCDAYPFVMSYLSNLYLHVFTSIKTVYCTPSQILEGSLGHLWT